MNNSPWIHQLNASREAKTLQHDLKTEIAIIGAGIAGVASAYYLLKHTKKSIALLEGYKLAHGATGHNAGQLVSYFERPFKEIVAEFGLEMAVEGEQAVVSAWELLDEMYQTAGLDLFLSRFESYTGLSTKEQILETLENDALRRAGGLQTKAIEIWEEAPFLHEIPEQYHRLMKLVSREEIALKLETFDPEYVAFYSASEGIMNSALFCQEMVVYLLRTYPERFALYEHTPVAKVIVHSDKVIIDAERCVVEAEDVVLCTNGFENINIITPEGLAVNTRFHHSLHGVVGFMSGYLESHTGVPAALSYFPKVDPGFAKRESESYFYVTRRPYEYEKNFKHNLISIGGPQFELERRAHYDRNLEFSAEAAAQIKAFVKHTYDKQADLEYLFMWHGVMGYTHNRLRMIGVDPRHAHLFYNLGCNGVGLLPSIFGGEKVARAIAGEKFPRSIFDIPQGE